MIGDGEGDGVIGGRKNGKGWKDRKSRWVEGNELVGRVKGLGRRLWKKW